MLVQKRQVKFPSGAYRSIVPIGTINQHVLINTESSLVVKVIHRKLIDYFWVLDEIISVDYMGKPLNINRTKR